MCKQMDGYFVVRYFKEDFYAKTGVLFPVQKYVFSLCFSLSLCFRFCFFFRLSLFLKSNNILSSNFRTADHRALFWMRNGAYFCGAKAAGWWSWPLPVSNTKAYSWSYNITPPYTSMPRCLVRLEGNFTLDFPALLNVSYGSHPILLPLSKPHFFSPTQIYFRPLIALTCMLPVSTCS
jgi:hypothetical protein